MGISHLGVLSVGTVLPGPEEIYMSFVNKQLEAACAQSGTQRAPSPPANASPLTPSPPVEDELSRLADFCDATSKVSPDPLPPPLPLSLSPS